MPRLEHGPSPDYGLWSRKKVCIPSFATLLPADRANGLLLNVRDAECEYHDPVTQRVKMGCTDDSCTNCKGEYRFLQNRRHMPGEDEPSLASPQCCGSSESLSPHKIRVIALI